MAPAGLGRQDAGAGIVAAMGCELGFRSPDAIVKPVQ